MLKGPIVIGGIGGSGTRVVASILREFDVFIGKDLNQPLDNLSHTLLFKRPKWYYKNRFNSKQINIGISIMEKSMIKRDPFSIDELKFLISATFSVARKGHNADKDGKGYWAFKRLFHILFNRQNDLSSYKGWGWKEPNSHLIIENLIEHFSGLKYIHTIRHGLDMAYSSNQQQLFNWGKLFGIEKPKSIGKIPQASFRYWVEANKRIIEMRKSYGDDKIMLLNFDELCSQPIWEVEKVANFIGIEITKNQLQKAVSLPSIPKTKNRFKIHDISEFQGDDLAFLKSLNYQL